MNAQELIAAHFDQTAHDNQGTRLWTGTPEAIAAQCLAALSSPATEECGTCEGRGSATLIHGENDYEDVGCPDGCTIGRVPRKVPCPNEWCVEGQVQRGNCPRCLGSGAIPSPAVLCVPVAGLDGLTAMVETVTLAKEYADWLDAEACGRDAGPAPFADRSTTTTTLACHLTVLSDFLSTLAEHQEQP